MRHDQSNRQIPPKEAAPAPTKMGRVRLKRIVLDRSMSATEAFAAVARGCIGHTDDAPKRVAATPNRFDPLLDGRMAGRRSGRNGCFGATLQAFYTGPEQYQQSLGDQCAHCRLLRTLPGFGHSIARRSLDEVAFILRHHTAAISSYDCTFDNLELVYQSLRTLEPPHTHKFPRVNAQDCKLGPIQPWDVKDFLRAWRQCREALLRADCELIPKPPEKWPLQQSAADERHPH